MESASTSASVRPARSAFESPALRVLLAMLLIATLAPPVGAASQNEVLITATWDGTAPYLADPLDDVGAYPSPHTPGADARGDNGVVRTYDLFGVAVDFNVNEAAAENVVLTVTLPEDVSWFPPPASDPAVGEMFAGCYGEAQGVTPISSISADGRTLVCNVGDRAEGSHGVVNPIALVEGRLDGDLLPVDVIMTTDADTTGATDELDVPLVVSAIPSGDWVKGSPDVTEIPGTGDLVVYPLTFTWSAGARGSEPMNDAVPVQFFDHAWDLPAGTTFATPADMPAGEVPCGQYDWGTPLATTGTWTCTQVSADPLVVQIDVTGHDTSDKNGVVSLHGQIAFVVPDGALETRWGLVEPLDTVYNSITGSASDAFDTFIKSWSDPVDHITPISVAGTNGTAFEPTANNTVVFSDTPIVTPGSSPGGLPWAHSAHTVRLTPGEYLEQVHPGRTDGREIRGPDRRSVDVGGMSGWASNAPNQNNPVSRGQTFTIMAGVSVAAFEAGVFDQPFHLCVGIDTDNYELVPFGDIPVSTINMAGETALYRAPSSGGTTIAASDGPLAHVLSGTSGIIMGDHLRSDGYPETFNVAGDPLSYTVEFGLGGQPGTTGAGEVGHDVGEDALTCDDADATSWVAASAIDPSQYSDISHVRVLTHGSVEWSWNAGFDPIPETYRSNGEPSGPAINLVLQAQVKRDIDVHVDGEELFVWASRGFGDWDAVGGVPSGIATDHQGAPIAEDFCFVESFEEEEWEDDLPTDGAGVNTITTTTGWCNEPYYDTLGDASHFSQASIGRYSTNPVIREFHAQKLHIVGAQLGVSKTNVDGINDFADNGDLVQFEIRPYVTGADAEALVGVNVTDNLNTTAYEFVRFVTQPATGPGCVESGNIVTCQFSEPDAAVDSDPTLAPGLPGGWSDSFIIEVRKVSGISTVPPAFNANAVLAESTGYGPWDPIAGDFSAVPIVYSSSAAGLAGSYMPPPHTDGAIIKTVDTLAGPCNLHPTDAPPPEGWENRCSKIAVDDAMSFVLSFTNEGNTTISGIEIVDVFPHNGDEVEPASNTSDQGVGVPTLGDGRSPETSIVSTIGFDSMVAVSAPGALTTWVTGDDPATISRDPDVTVGDAANTWCDGVGGAVQVGTGTCPATAEDVTATYTSVAGTLNPSETMELRLTLTTSGAACSDIWTNTFGARVEELALPIRSNDVSVMVDCNFDLAIEKTVDPAWTPDTDWLTTGTSTVDFLLEITNQADPVNGIVVSEYPGSGLVFEVANNPDGATSGDASLGYTWDLTDPTRPVVSIDGALGTGESVFVPVTLTVGPDWPGGAIEAWAEISEFDDDGDPGTGTSATGAVVDGDSTPDTTNNEPADGLLEDGVIDEGPVVGDLSGDGVVDEDDHDVASVPVWDLELVKTARSVVPDDSTDPASVTYDLAVTNQGSADVYLVDVVDYGGAGLAYNAAATAALWTAESVDGVTDAAPTFEMAGPIAPGATFTFPVVYDVTDTTMATYTNAAEIAGFDNDADAGNPADPLAVDVDSTPDVTNDDAVIDVDAPGYDADNDGNLNEPNPGDEDDHDIAVVGQQPRRLGNQVWADANNNGVFDAGERPIAGVMVSLFADDDGDGLADDTNDDGVIDALDALAMKTTDADGNYLFEDLEPGTYVVGVDPDNFASGGPLYGTVPSYVVSLDPEDEVDSDNNGIAGEGGYAWSGSVILDTGEPLGPDPALADGYTNLTIDFGFWQPTFDLALRKTLAGEPTPFGVGDVVVYEIEVFNQGDVAAGDVRVVDYLPEGLELEDADWTTDGVMVSYEYAGEIPAGESVTIPITTRVAEGAEGVIINNAEIAGAEAYVDGGPLRMPNGMPLPDVDSVADENPDDSLVDDALDAVGDEDDHDVAGIEVLAPVDPTDPGAGQVDDPDDDVDSGDLVNTGFDLGPALMVAMLLVVAGFGLVRVARRQNDPI